MTLPQPHPSPDQPHVLDARWTAPFTEVLAAHPKAWSNAWDVARRIGQGKPNEPSLAETPAWSPLQDAWRADPAMGRRWAWEVGHRAWLPPLQAVVDAGLIAVNDLEKPRATMFPLRLAETMEDKHPHVFRWLVEQGEPADRPWGNGTTCLRERIHAQSRKKMARLWLQRPEERAPVHLGAWIAAQWEAQGGDDLRALLWSAWDDALAPLPPEEQAGHNHQAATLWAQRLIEHKGWSPRHDRVLTDQMAKDCWSRWTTELGDGFLFGWTRMLNAGLEHENPNERKNVSPAFASWFNEELRLALQRQETRELRATLDESQPDLTPARPRARL